MRLFATPLRAVLFVSLVVLSVRQTTIVSTQELDQRGAPGQGDLQRADPCAHMPDPPGKAEGIDKKCPPAGSSSGVAKGDFNNDGIADLAVGEPGATIGGNANAGDVIVIYGSPSGLSSSAVRVPQLWYEGPDRHMPSKPEAGDKFGSSLASGDFNGDGYSDLAIGIPGKTVTFTDFLGFKHPYAEAGAVAIIYGSKNGLTSTDSIIRPPQYFDVADFITDNCPFPQSLLSNIVACNLGQPLPDSHAGDHLGQALAWGDFDGNHFGDLAIGIPGYDNSAGAVWVLKGDTGGLDDRVFESDGDSRPPFPKSSVLEGGIRARDRFGASLSAGDFDGNGTSDLAIGVPGRTLGIFVNGSCATNCRQEAGAVTIDMDPLGIQIGVTEQTWTLDALGLGSGGGDHFGAALAAGDFNGDSKSDLAIGAPNDDVIGFADAGSVTILYGTGSGLSNLNFQALSLIDFAPAFQEYSYFGAALAAGDLNGDARSDLAIGVPGATISVVRSGVQKTLTGAGAVAVNYGSPQPLTVVVRARQYFNQDTVSAGHAQSGAAFGSSLTAWNFGRPETACCLLGKSFAVGAADLAIGAPNYSPRPLAPIQSAGEVDVVYGSYISLNNGLVFTSPNIWTGDNLGFGSLAGAHFGAAVY
jgi:hypothetical protein